MTNMIETEIRSVRRQYVNLKQPFTDFELLDPMSKARGLRVGPGSCFTFPHEGILDAILNLAQSVWHFKDYLIEAHGKDKPVEAYCESIIGLLIVSDLANKKKHCKLRRKDGRSGLAPCLGIHDGKKTHYNVVEFDTRENGIVEFYYNGKTRSSCVSVTRPVGIPFRTEILVKDEHGEGTKGNAVDFIFKAFKKWEPIMEQLGLRPRPEYIE